jgi:hypothetical protein
MAQNPRMQSSATPIDQLRQEHERQTALFDRQPGIVQRFLEAQARQIAEAYVERAHSVRFTLPDRVVVEENAQPIPVPADMRQQHVGTFSERLANRDVHETLRKRLAELNQSSELAVCVCADLIRFSAANHMIKNMLPAGRSVNYISADDDDIPSIPATNNIEPESAITASTDAIAEELNTEEGRGTLQVPFVPAARRFYLPQWVAFDNEDKLIVSSLGEAEAHIASMQRFMTILFAARSLAPYMVADEDFEAKRYGMLGQLVNQGRALARYRTRDIIETIKKRAEAQSLNRGLSLSLPYFDDQDLRIEAYNFVVIPAGRIMFVPAFVVRAAVEEQAKVAQDTRFNVPTRKHLLDNLRMIEIAFFNPDSV